LCGLACQEAIDAVSHMILEVLPLQSSHILVVDASGIGYRSFWIG